ncbi:Sensor histidine kinase RcsC [Methylobacterium adhaesivum]|uniref:Response regulator n=1 Tax=Methylobacterium adhaesivum TaxID=333297 RepID=A0ABT8BG31_9HYPH|nr:response regulator [Methylobacterium adhaesivum]MDN3590407.1 response regulator [Methylobacterium adhaesivum]GJD32396.1 Sensor histidine kinase RcsC [Methylobacterium adhaesivum]
MSPETTEFGPSGAGTRILLVEDDPDTQALIRALCESRGDRVDIAADGFLGLRLLSERRHGIVLIDYHLPEMDGYALARLMRELARTQDRVRLVGITADHLGLASRRGADTLFDAILVKPLDPATLFATLDRLLQPATGPGTAEPADVPLHPADVLWRRRGLKGLPRAILYPAPSDAEAEAVAQAFAPAVTASDADIVLISAEAGLDDLRELRAAGPAGLLPAFDLTGRFAAACDGVFRVGDPDSWTALAETALAFARRRAALPSDLPTDPAARLAALLFVADRSLGLRAGDAAPGATYETGLSKVDLMAVVLQLMEAGSLACEPEAGGIVAALTSAGRDAVLCVGRSEAGTGWQPPRVRECTETVPEPGTSALGPAPAASPAHPIDPKRLAALEALVGARQVDELVARLCRTLEVAFPPDGEWEAAGRVAHALISAAGSLGFDRVAHTCRALQDVIAAGGDPAQSLQDARSASREAHALCLRRLQGLPLGVA